MSYMNYANWEDQYLGLIRNILDFGTDQLNERTGKVCRFYHGDMMKFDLASGYFPLLTTKKMAYKAMIGELIGFLRAADNAKTFRDLKCNFWNANANESAHWLENPNRKGEDDLGRIYGVQARDWGGSISYPLDLDTMEIDESSPTHHPGIDQLGIVVDKLHEGIDDRRLIVTHWNPGELNKMALPPCHLLYQFGLRGPYLDLTMYQRSCDVPLGIPMNIASYALLLNIVAQIVGRVPGILTHFMHNIHIYEDQMGPELDEQLSREPLIPPKLVINPEISSLDDFEDWVSVDDFTIIDYESHGKLAYAFSE